MDKLAPWPKGIARLLIAGLLAWAVLVQGVAAAVVARSGAADAGVTLSDGDRCTSDAHRQSPERHAPCSCCIPCRPGVGGVETLLEPAAVGAPLSPRIAIRLRAEPPSATQPSSPPGWTSSWSQRAPPRAAATFSPPRDHKA